MPPRGPPRGLPRRRSSPGRVGLAAARPASATSREVSLSTLSGEAPFWGAKTSAASSKGTEVSQRTSSFAPRSPAASRASIAPWPPSVVALPPAATSTRRAPASTAAAISSPVPALLARSGSRSSSPTRSRPDAAATSTIAVEPSRTRPYSASIGRPMGSWHGRRTQLAVHCGHEHRRRPLAAVSGRAEVGPGTAALQPRADRVRDLAGAQRSLEGIGRYQERFRRRASRRPARTCRRRRSA